MRLIVRAKHSTARETVKKKSRKKKKRREVTLEDDGKLCLKTVPWKTSYVYFRNEKLSLYKKVLRAN